ncbi:MAG: hypothetical protein ABIT08_09265 [Bacteroidia bacterium]
MTSVCFFSSYFKGDSIPFYVKIYLDELKRHFSQIVLLTNQKHLAERELKYLSESNFQIRYYKNEGYDFGMWFKAFNEFPVHDYDRIALVNDSCILFKRLDKFFEWIEKSDFDVYGMTDSNAISYHLQSYFLVLKKASIIQVKNYFNEQNIKENVRDVILQYEVGLSSYLIKMKMRLSANFKHIDFLSEHNPMLYFSDELIKKGMPLIKKKIIYCSFRKEEYFSLMRMNFNIDPRHHIKLIKKVNGNNLIIDFDLITKDIFTSDFFRRIQIYRIKNYLFQLMRKLKFWK